MDLPSGIVSFLFTDIEDSSRKWDADRAAMESAVALHDALLDADITTNGGHLIKKMGDGMMAAFGDPADAVRAAVAGQHSLSGTRWDAAIGPVLVRMGIHTGPGEPREGDYLGPSINRAARIEAAGYGGQIIVSAATRELVANRLDNVEFRDLGQHQLRGLSRPEQIYQVVPDGLMIEFPPLRTESTPSNLPAPIKRFVGRIKEIEELSATLDGNRLVTVTGPGGAGKTSLAIETARQRAERHPGGVWLFALATITDGRIIPTEMLGTMRRPAPADTNPLVTLTTGLGPQRSLLILDNCEHLIEAVADIVAAILRAAPNVTILATSREALGLGGEQIWNIPTLDQPTVADRVSVDRSDAGALFVERAHSADPRFTLTDENASVIADICRRLDGLPLAIELAAARTRSMGLSEIDRRLEDRFRLLTSGEHDATPHHQTLQSTVRWSYDLLNSDIQALYRRLSIFAGGFDLEAAEATTGDGVPVLDGIDNLVAQSLLVADRGDPTRYRMLETIRQFGTDQLIAAGEFDTASQAHFEWVRALVKEGARQLEGPDQVTWLKRFRREIDNLRSALRWARDHDPVAGSAVVAAISRFFWMYAAERDSTSMHDATSFLREGHDWATSMLAAAGDDLPLPVRARLQMAIGGLLCSRIGKFEEALERLDQAMTIFEELDDPRNLGWATFYRGCAGVGLVPLEETVASFVRSTELHTRVGDSFGMIIGTLLRGFYQVTLDAEAARAAIDWVSATAEKVGVPALIAHGADATSQADASFSTVTEDTRRRSAQALIMFRNLSNYACLCHTLHGAASVLAASGNVEAAARSYGLSEAIRNKLSMVIAPYERRDWMIADIVGEAFEDEAWQAARAEGRTFEPDEGIDWVITELGFDPSKPDLITSESASS